MGVGGDTAWTRSVLPRYFVPPGTHRWAVRLRPFSGAAPPHPNPNANPNPNPNPNPNLQRGKLRLERGELVRSARRLQLRLRDRGARYEPDMGEICTRYSRELDVIQPRYRRDVGEM